MDIDARELEIKRTKKVFFGQIWQNILFFGGQWWGPFTLLFIFGFFENALGSDNSLCI
jgi:hypothetical protein